MSSAAQTEVHYSVFSSSGSNFKGGVCISGQSRLLCQVRACTCDRWYITLGEFKSDSAIYLAVLFGAQARVELADVMKLKCQTQPW